MPNGETANAYGIRGYHFDVSKKKPATPQIMDETELTATVVVNQRSYEVPKDVADAYNKLLEEKSHAQTQ